MREALTAMENKMKLMELATTSAVTPSASAEMMDIMAVGLKLPNFHETRPEQWFHHAECQFRLRRIVDDQTKFDHVYQCLSEKQAARVEPLLQSLPKTGKFEALKDLLFRHFGRTQFEKDTELLQHGPLGDMSVLDFVGQVQSLNKDPATFLKAFVLNKIPAGVRGTLANTEFNNLTDLAIAADKVLKAKGKATVNNVAEEEADDDLEVDAVKFPSKNQGRQARFSDKPRGGQAGGQARPKTGGSCFYHEKHGPKAFKCEGNGCVWSSTPLAARPSGNGPAGR